MEFPDLFLFLSCQALQGCNRTKRSKTQGRQLPYFLNLIAPMELYHDSTIQLIKVQGFILGFVVGFVVFWLPPKIKKAIKKHKQSQTENLPK